jgi:hypothetical protein
MNIGIIYCAYNTIEYIKDSIAPWLKLKQNYSISIAAISAPFEEFPIEDSAPDGTTDFLKNLYLDKKIDFFFEEPKFQKEHVLRDLALQTLLKHGDYDFIWLVDSDEIYLINEIKNILDFLSQNPYVGSYELYFKNYFQNTKTFYCTNFVRIFNNKINGGIKNFSWDCEVIYKDGSHFKSLATKIIDKSLCFVSHYTWLSDRRSYSKIKYQKKHFGACSFRWNLDSSTIEIDENFFRMTGYKKPVLEYEN